MNNSIGLTYRSTSEKILGQTVRLFHLKVSNKSRVADTNVLVFVEKIERKINGKWKPEYREGPVPLKWQFCTKIEGGRRIGMRHMCDFVRVTEKKGLWLDVEFDTASLEDFHRLQPGNEDSMRVTVFAAGDNAESPRLRVVIDYNGVWSLDDIEMSTNLTFDPRTIE